MSLNLREATIRVSDKDEDYEIELTVEGNGKCYQQSQWINKDQALEIINHLKQQFGL